MQKRPPDVYRIQFGISQLGPALDYIATHYATEISLERLARLCGISLTHFRRQFREILGKSPHRYLLELRVQAAAAAMRDVRKRISEAAFDVGFSTLSTFNRAFRDVLGEAPRTWRSSRHSTRNPNLGRTKPTQNH